MPKVDIDTAYIEKLAELLARTGPDRDRDLPGRHAHPRGQAGRRRRSSTSSTAPAAPRPPAPAMPVGGAAPPGRRRSIPGTITSPMVGTVYLLPEPGAAPFVKVGDLVKEGQTLLIIEAMKVMNSIRAPRAGRVARIFATNAAPVEYGEPLLIVE